MLGALIFWNMSESLSAIFSIIHQAVEWRMTLWRATLGLDKSARPRTLDCVRLLIAQLLVDLGRVGMLMAIGRLYLV